MEKQQQNTKAETASRHNGQHDKAQQADTLTRIQMSL